MENGNERQGRSEAQYRNSAIGACIGIISLIISFILIAIFE